MDMQLINKYNKVFRFLLCAIDIFSKYARVFLWKTKTALRLLMLFKNFSMGIIANQIKYGSTKVVNFTIDQWDHGFKIMVLKCIHHIMNKNLLLLEDLLET